MAALADLRRAIESLAVQNLPSEDPEVAEDGDFEGAYIIMVNEARKALTALEAVEREQINVLKSVRSLILKTNAENKMIRGYELALLVEAISILDREFPAIALKEDA